MKVKINIRVNDKKITLPDNTRILIRKACKKTLELEEFPFDAEVDVTIVDDAKIKEMNALYRKIDESTDVLSFPLGDNGEYDTNPETDAKMLGDIVISIDHALYQADLFGHGVEREIAYLSVHSMLHLIGYDHVHNDKEKAVMRAKEEAVLKKMGLEIKQSEN